MVRLPRPWPPAGPAVRAPVAPASFTPHPSLRSFVQSGGVAAHPPRMLAPSIPGGCACTKKNRPVTDAKEVGVGNAAEETFCHRTIPVIHHIWEMGKTPFAICSPSIAHKNPTLPATQISRNVKEFTKIVSAKRTTARRSAWRESGLRVCPGSIGRAVDNGMAGALAPGAFPTLPRLISCGASPGRRAFADCMRTVCGINNLSTTVVA